jgi:hypothetical protein
MVQNKMIQPGSRRDQEEWEELERKKVKRKGCGEVEKTGDSYTDLYKMETMLEEEGQVTDS